MFPGYAAQFLQSRDSHTGNVCLSRSPKTRGHDFAPHSKALQGINWRSFCRFNCSLNLLRPNKYRRQISPGQRNVLGRASFELQANTPRECCEGNKFIHAVSSYTHTKIYSKRLMPLYFQRKANLYTVQIIL